MKAVVQDTYGSAAVLETRDIDRPEIGGDEVLVRVRAAGVNPADWAIMSGLPYIARPVYGLRKPKNAVRGTDVAGTVEAVGTGVTWSQPGDEVFGWCRGLARWGLCRVRGRLRRCTGAQAGQPQLRAGCGRSQ